MGSPGLIGREFDSHFFSCSALFVAITGYGQEQDRQAACRGRLLDHHLVKPADSDRLIRLLRQAGSSPVRAAQVG